MNYKRILSILAVLSLLLTVVPRQGRAEGIQLASEAAVLMDAQTGQVLYEKNAHVPMYPASITKVMTGYLALSELEPGQILTVSQEAVNAVPPTSSHIGLQPGQQLTLEQTMYALALMSANDAANVLAEAVSGSLEAFGQHMTQEAVALGAQNTNFTNANGLPDSNHYTTAYDMALITAAAIQTPGFCDYFSATDYTDSFCNFHNKNRMLSGYYHYDGLLMSKTGWTSAAQGTLVTAVEQGDTTLIAVVLKSVMTESKYSDTKQLIDYGFSRFTPVTFTGEELAAMVGTGNFVPAPGQEIRLLIPVEADPSAITCNLGDGMSLNTDADQTAVTVELHLDDLALPGITLVLLRSEEEAVPVLIAEPETAPPVVELTPEEESINWLQVGIASAALLLFIGARVRYIHQRERRHRRRQLEGRIRQMKKRMEE